MRTDPIKTGYIFPIRSNGARWGQSTAYDPRDLKGIEISLDGFAEWWAAAVPALSRTRLSHNYTEERRYFESGAPFPYGDAMILRGMIFSARPRRIVEIGSGFSTACMLDSLDEFGLVDCQVTCIEPFPDRLIKLMRLNDHERLKIIKSDVQSVPLPLFQALQEGDILFIDSTHVLKTGSDVHYEIFEILPSLSTGVLVHVHDCPYPFEYPNEWIFDKNYSWNEAYALRAFLMFNRQFSIVFWSSLFRRMFPDKWLSDVPQAKGKNPGTSIWLRRIA